MKLALAVSLLAACSLLWWLLSRGHESYPARYRYVEDDDGQVTFV